MTMPGGITGARRGALSGLRRLVASALAQDLQAFVVPGAGVGRARGLDLAGAGLRLAATPRHAGVLLVVGPLAAGLRDAATIAYAQMPRPRAILALGAGDLAPLPAADVTAPLSQAGLSAGLADLRRVIATGAFAAESAEFTAPALETRVEYTCPMHPEIIRDEPGNCPKCGMTLVPRETAADQVHSGHAPATDEVAMQNHQPTPQPPAAQNHASAEAAQYTCPMHPEVLSDTPDSCPKCGMTLVPVEEKGEDHSGHSGHSGHGGHGSAASVDGIEPQFMSMVDVTKGLPRSSDGLQMDWIKVPFGPFFPGLPGGLGLEFTMDGDTVVDSAADSLVAYSAPLLTTPLSVRDFVARLAGLMPLAPVSYTCLAALAVEDAADVTVSGEIARGRAAALERERIASHLSWLADFATQSGFGWLTTRAAGLQLAVQVADAVRMAALTPEIIALLRRLHATPLLRMRLAGIARLDAAAQASGPIARALGQGGDARDGNKTYAALGFEIAAATGDDALARLQLRCDEIAQSLALIAAAGVIAPAVVADIDAASGSGAATLETPRGAAYLRLQLAAGKVVEAELDTPSTRHLALIGGVVAQQELGDALVGVASLDISPWEMRV